MSSFKLKGRESELCTQNYWSEALLTLNLQFTRNGRFSWFVCLPPDWQWRQSHFHSSWYFRAFSRGRSEDCSMSLSLRKMSGISVEIYCCLLKLYLLLTCHNVASAFLQASGECGSDPTGNGSTGLWEGRSGARRPKRNWAKSGRPCSGKTPKDTEGPSARGGCGSFYHTRGTAWPRHLREVTDNGISGEVKIGKISSQDSSLHWTDDLVLTGWTPQFAVVMILLPSAELKVSAAEVTLLANWPRATHCSP